MEIQNSQDFCYAKLKSRRQHKSWCAASSHVMFGIIENTY
jgi:hypothetical protein